MYSHRVAKYESRDHAMIDMENSTDDGCNKKIKNKTCSSSLYTDWRARGSNEGTYIIAVFYFYTLIYVVKTMLQVLFTYILRYR